MRRKVRIQRKRREGGRTEESERVGEMVVSEGETKEGEERERRRKKEGRAEGHTWEREREEGERL